jgi:hypothetical protein
MVRGMLAIFILPTFKFFRGITDFYQAGFITSVLIMILATAALYLIEETFNKDLDFIEE